jgi:hypothetical protein
MNKLEYSSFVIMPFAQQFSAVYNGIIKPALDACGIQGVRADEDPQGHIHSQMLQRIFESDIVIVDITGLNPNVFYELGIAHSIGCKTILLCEDSNLDRIPFDIAPYRVLAYQKPDRNNTASAKETIEKLKAEIESVIQEESEGIPNPVQDFLTSQSPVHSSNSLFLNEFAVEVEQELFQTTKKEIVYFGLTANSFVDVLMGTIESRHRNRPLTVRLILLNPRASDCWAFVYRMREEGPVKPGSLEEFMQEDVLIQRRSIRRLESLALRIEGFSMQVHYYDFPPLFWAYLIDQERLIVGYLAMHRYTARNLPVNILVKGDRSTRNLFAYYKKILETIVHPWEI